MRQRVGSLACALLTSAACAHAPPPTVRVVRPGELAGYPIQPMHLTAITGAHGSTARADLELRGDGALIWQGNPAGRLAGAHVLAQDGHEIAGVDRDGNVAWNGPQHHRVRIVEGAVIVDDDARYYFDEQGRVVESRPGQRPRWIFLQLQGWSHETLPTGALMVLFTMVRTHRI
jgi:hypothetical protein